ncbi:TonB-dependent receptor [Teredinibacter purpureus]|uniref:TonB-dependent receptor n=1 Tax=Teredinibacter purpureus TaxID=2731756 RepID=UPI0006967F02|nr:TonB-dependent receptor [Teredinibacter purpureus]
MKKLFDNSSASYLTMICALGLLSGNAAAQTAIDEEEVIVRGFAGSLEKALDRKRESDSLVEVVASDDLGVLPDVSITDSLTRLPGVASSRDRGNASSISIRGMGARLNIATMNNREIVSAEPSRDVRYEQFPAELIDSVEVYKSPSANKVEGGISGLVNMNIVSPLQKNKRMVSLNGYWMNNALGDELPETDGNGYKASFSYVDQYADNFGVAFGLAYQDQPSLQREVTSWAYNSHPSTTGDLGSPAEGLMYDSGTWDDNGVETPWYSGVGDGTPEDVTWGAKAASKQGSTERLGAVAVLEWEPTEALSLKYDLFYSQFDITEREDQMYYADFGNWQNGNLEDYINSDTDAVITEDSNGVQSVVSAGFYDPTDGTHNTLHNANWFQTNEMMSTGLNAVYAGSVWQVSADVGYSEASIDSVWIDIASNRNESWGDADGDGIWTITESADIGWDIRSGQMAIWQNNVSDANSVSNPANYTLDATSYSDVWSQDDSGTWYNATAAGEIPAEFGGSTMTGDSDRILTDAMTSMNLDFERELDWGTIAGVSFGGRYTSREKENDVVTWVKNASTEVSLADVGAYSYSLGDNIVAPALIGLEDWDGVAQDVFGGFANRSSVVPSDDDKAASWLLTEDNAALYGMFSLSGEMGSVPFSGNVGARYVSTSTTSSAYEQQLDGSLAAVSIDHEYSELLPSLNMVFEVSDSAQVRLGLARTLSRPPLVEMRAGTTIQRQDLPYTMTRGNPTLDPFLANQFDLGYELYWGDNAAATIGYFYKDMSTHVGNGTDIVLDESVQGAGGTLERTTPLNGDGGTLQGIELMYQQPFDMLPEPFNGLGMFANYSYVDTDITEFTPDSNPYTLGGLSKDVASVTFWYDYNNFDARVSWNYRSEFTSINSWNPSDISLNDAEATIDASIGYAVNDNLRFTLQAQNMTDEAANNYRDNDTARPGSYIEWGRRILLGVSYSL